MTGPEHYAEAERLLDGPDPEGRIYPYDDRGWQLDRRDYLAAAQVHATLALAAAAAVGVNRPAWLDVAT